MNNYILTPDGNFVSADELYHYGVKGMKWGVRKGRYYSYTNDKVGDNYTDRQKKKNESTSTIDTQETKTQIR